MDTSTRKLNINLTENDKKKLKKILDEKRRYDDIKNIYTNLWNHGYVDLAVTVWSIYMRIDDPISKKIFLYVHDKYHTDIADCTLDISQIDVLLFYKTSSPENLLHFFADHVYIPRVLSIANKYCKIYPSVAEIWKNMKNKPFIEIDSTDGHIRKYYYIITEGITNMISQGNTFFIPDVDNTIDDSDELSETIDIYINCKHRGLHRRNLMSRHQVQRH